MIIVFEGAITRLLKANDNRHDFAKDQSGLALPSCRPRFEWFGSESGFEGLAEIVKIGKKG